MVETNSVVIQRNIEVENGVNRKGLARRLENEHARSVEGIVEAGRVAVKGKGENVTIHVEVDVGIAKGAVNSLVNFHVVLNDVYVGSDAITHANSNNLMDVTVVERN